MDWQTTLIPIAEWGAVGAFADFLIGRIGQERVRDRLETWWIQFSDVKLRNFGREEARLAVSVLDRLFGRLLSLRRAASVSAIALLFVVLYTVRGSFEHFNLQNWPYGAIDLALSIFAVAVSISITRFAARKVAERLPDGVIQSLLAFLFLVVIQCVMIWLWALTHTLSIVEELLDNFDSLITLSKPSHPYMGYLARRLQVILYPLLGMFGYNPKIIPELLPRVSVFYVFSLTKSILSAGGFHDAKSIGEAAAFSTQYLVTLIRLLVSALFLLSYALRPIHTVITTIWLRILESDKPIFTLSFGGAAGIAKGLDEIVKHL